MHSVPCCQDAAARSDPCMLLSHPPEKGQGDLAAPGWTRVAQLWVPHCPGPSSPPQGFIEISRLSASKIISEIFTALRAVIIYPYMFPQEQGSRSTIPSSSSLIPSLQTVFFLIDTNITNTPPRACCPFSVPAREMGAHPSRTPRAGFLLPLLWLTLLQGHSSHAQAV